MRKVLFGTPCYDGRVHVEFLHSLLGTLALATERDIQIYPVQVSHDALVQRARNDLVRIAIETQCDDLIFMDGDQEWLPEWVFRLLDHQVDVVGCPVVKKSDAVDYNVKLLPEGLLAPVNHLLRVASVGTGFLRISKAALTRVWDISTPYANGPSSSRMVFEPRVEDGELVSEDAVFCNKWRELGGQVWVDPSMTCAHIGQKKWHGNFAEFIGGVNLAVENAMLRARLAEMEQT